MSEAKCLIYSARMGRVMATEYPKRPRFFAHQFTRLMGKVCLANELGPGAYCLLAVIAHTEDAKGYRDAVTFFNEQLYPIVGAGSVDSLDRVRKKAIDAGWLTYIAGGKGRPGRYWVMIPDRFNNVDDAPTDENPAEYVSDSSAPVRREPRENEDTSAPVRKEVRREPRDKCGENRETSAEHSSLPLPKDTKKEKTDAAPPKKRFVKPTLEELTEYCAKRGNIIDPEHFLAHYESNGWKVGGNPMVNWQAAVWTWEKNEKTRRKQFEKPAAKNSPEAHAEAARRGQEQGEKFEKRLNELREQERKDKESRGK